MIVYSIRPRLFTPALLALLLIAGCRPAAGPLPMVAPSEQHTRALSPHPAPERWQGVIGMYAAGADTLSILEKDLRLHLLLGGITYPLTEISADSFRLPSWGRYSGQTVVFTRGGDGRATGLEAAGGAFEALATGAEGARSFHITPVRPVAELQREALAAQPPTETGDFLQPDLVELATLDPTLKFDIRYATTNNFMGAVFYSEPRAFLQRPAAEALQRAHHRLRELGYGLLIHDAYRPWYVTRMFWDATPESMKHFVADPAAGSRHNRGAAVDLTLYDLRTGQPVEMVGGYDEFSGRSYPDYPGGTSLQRWHRELLRDAMEAEGFRVYDFEWWHFDYGEWRRYPIQNLTFDRIPSGRRER